MIKLLSISMYLIIVATLASGCAGSKTKLIGKDLPPLKQIYTEKLSGSTDLDQEPVNRPIQTIGDDLHGSAQQTYRELKQQFPYLPNPVLMIYVFPHLTEAGTPIPGYSTYFTFYERDQVALPHEVTTTKPTTRAQP